MNYGKILFALGASALILAACSDEKKTPEVKAEDEMPEIDVERALEELRAELNEGRDTGQAEKVHTTQNAVLNPYMAEMTEGDVEVLYTNEKPVMLHDMNGFFVSIDNYQITKVSDVNRLNESIFQGETGGYVVTASMTIENNRETPVYYSNYPTINLEDREDRLTGNKYYFVPPEEMLQPDNSEEQDRYPPGFKKQGFLSFVMTEEQYEKMVEIQPKIVISGGAREEKEDYSRKFGDAVFDFSYSDESEKELATAPEYYRDEIVNQNLGNKTMLYEKTGIGQVLSLGGVDVEFEGVQYTEILPSPKKMDKFYGFEEGDPIAALTVKFRIENNSEETLDLSAIYSTLYDENENRYKRESMFEPNMIRLLEPGESGEKLHVFLFTKEELGRPESLFLAFGPFGGDDGKRLFKGRDIVFKIPY